jgi:hypothetical protein
MGGRERCIQCFVGKPKENSRPPGRSRRRLEDNITMHFQKEDGDVKWIDLAKDWRGYEMFRAR